LLLLPITVGAGGGSSIYPACPLERCFRDVHTLSQHTSMHSSNYEVCGRVLLGRRPTGVASEVGVCFRCADHASRGREVVQQRGRAAQSNAPAKKSNAAP
jgi:hypothetical protein